jgi:hypothetical protein
LPIRIRWLRPLHGRPEGTTFDTAKRRAPEFPAPAIRRAGIEERSGRMRKPAGVRFENFVEAQIRRAREQGQFDDLPGKGKPLEDLQDAYDPLWWGKKLVKREGVSVLPPALEIRKVVETEMKRILALRDEDRVRDAVAKLNDQILHVNRSNVSGPPTTQSVLDADAVVERWRSQRHSRNG